MRHALKLFCWMGILGMLHTESVWALPVLPSVDSLTQVLKQQLADGELKLAAQSYEKLGGLYHQQYGYNKYTIDAYFNALKYYHRIGDSVNYYNVHLTIGDYYTHDNFMQKAAEKYFQKALRYFVRTHNTPKVIEGKIGLANIAQNRPPIKPTLITELRMLEGLSQKQHLDYFQAYAMNLLATTYLQAKQPDSARFFALKSLQIGEKQKIGWLIALNHFYLGIAEQFKNHPKEAIRAFNKSSFLADSVNNMLMLHQLAKHTAESYSYMGDYQRAYASLIRSLEYTQKFYNSEQTKSIRLQELDSQIKTLAVEKQLAEEQSQHQRFLNSMLITGLIISILGVGALIFLRRQQRLISQQQSVIAQQQIRELELKNLRAMIEGQESERSRIARDLHDGLGIQLSRIKLFVEAHQEQLPLSVKTPLNQFLDEACMETRLISNDLRPYALSTFGLFPALEDLVQKLNLVNETTLTLEHYGEIPNLNDEASVMLYRVLQELLNNALKHANAQNITVQLITNEETALISVDDDGMGGVFEEDSATGNGIANIKSRIAYLGGQVMWQSESGKGTYVMISVPMQGLLHVPS